MFNLTKQVVDFQGTLYIVKRIIKEEHIKNKDYRKVINNSHNRLKYKNKCGIDPGVRTFLTVYAKDNVHEIGTKSDNMLNKYYNKSTLGCVFSDKYNDKTAFNMLVSGLKVIEYNSKLTSFDLPSFIFTKINSIKQRRKYHGRLSEFREVWIC